MNTKATAHFVVYLLEDGTLKFGDACQTAECAVNSVHYNEGAKLLGPFSVEVDSTQALSRTDLFKKLDVKVDIGRALTGIYHECLEPVLHNTEEVVEKKAA